MRYVCLVYMAEKDLDAIPDRECMTFSNGLSDSGRHVASDALQRTDTATTVRVRNGRVSITDGPFAETKEQLAGFYVIEAQTLDEAIGIASKIPPARVGSIEVRPVRQLAVK